MPASPKIPRHLLWDAPTHWGFIPEWQLPEHKVHQLHWLTLHRDAFYSWFVLMLRYTDDLGNIDLLPESLETFNQHSFLREPCDTFLMESSARKKLSPQKKKQKFENPFFLPYSENYVNYTTASHAVAQAVLELMMAMPLSQSSKCGDSLSYYFPWLPDVQRPFNVSLQSQTY